MVIIYRVKLQYWYHISLILWHKRFSTYDSTDGSMKSLACVASVSVGFGSKERERGFWYFACAENGATAKKKNGGGRGGEGRNRLRTNPWILKTPVRWRTGLVIGWASRTFLTCVDQRS